MNQQIITNIYNHSKSKPKLRNNPIKYYSAQLSYFNCENITQKLMEYNKFQDNKTLSDFIAYSNRNFTRKKQAMKILENLSELNDERIKLKDSAEVKEQKDDKKEQKGKKKTLIVSTRVKNEEEENSAQLSLIQADSFEDNLESNEKKNELEISMVGVEKIEKKKKNVTEIQNLIKKCNEDIDNLDILIKKYRYATQDFFMKSEIIDDKSMICINKKDFEETDEDLDKKAKYFNGLKDEFVYLKKRLENLLSMYNSEKTLTELKKRELENLESLNKKYKELKLLKYNKKK